MTKYMNKSYITYFATILFLFLLNSCSSLDKSKSGIAVYQKEFYGLITADEPKAVLVGKDILSYGGNASDAAVAMAFTMSTTYPSRVSLAGGGICQIFDPNAKEKVSSINFMPKRAENSDVAIPALPRGLFALYAKYGSLRWEELVIPAENIARFSTPISRALAKDIEKYIKSPKTKQDDKGNVKQNDIIKYFSNKNFLLKEGDMYKQLELASILTSIRTKGVGEFYSGLLAQRIVDNAKEAGFNINKQEFAKYIPVIEESLSVKIKNNKLYQPKELNVSAGQIKTVGTSFVVTDYKGQTVSCSLTNGKLFGKGKLLKEVGLFLAEPIKDSKGDISNIVMINDNTNSFRYAGASFGNKNKKYNQDLAKEIALKGEKADIFSIKQKYETKDNKAINKLNFVSCPKGVKTYANSCIAQNDSRGYGLAKYLGSAIKREKIYNPKRNKVFIEKSK